MPKAKGTKKNILFWKWLRYGKEGEPFLLRFFRILLAIIIIVGGGTIMLIILSVILFA
jgi:hypothetical protein